MRKSEGTAESTFDKDVVTLGKQLLISHLNVALLGMIFVLVLSLLGHWYYSRLKLFSDSYWPSAQNLLQLEDGVHRSHSLLHQGISLKSKGYLVAREDIWETIIRPSWHELNSRTLLSNNEKLDHQQIKLEKLSLLLPKLDSIQWTMADIALTEGNLPARLILEQKLEQGSQLLLRQIDALRYSLQERVASEDDWATESLLSGLSEKIDACNFYLSIGIYSQRQDMQVYIVKCHNLLLVAQESLLLANPIFKGMNSALYKEYTREFEAYKRLITQVMGISELKQYNIALYRLKEHATPLAQEVDLLLKSISQTYLRNVEQELALVNRITFYSLPAIIVAIFILALIAIILSQKSATRIASPITALARVTKGMMKPTGLETMELPVHGVRELRDLISSFNHLQLALVERGKQLREREAYYKSIIENSVDPVVVISELGIIELFNGAASRVFGYTNEDAIGKNVSMLVPKNIRSEHDDYLENYIKTGQAKIIGIGREVEAVRKNGRHFPIYLALSEILLPSGGRHFVGIIRDESKKKDMESELLRAHKLEAVGHLAAGIAHEINTPIQFVSDNLTFLNNAFENLLGLLSLYEKLAACVARNQDTTKMMTEIRAKVEAADLEYLLEEIPNAAGQSLEGIHRISVIVRAMKEFSHPGSASKEWVDINHAISTTITIASNEWKYVAQLKTDLDPSLPSVMVCLTEINQTVLNMIVNAAHTIAERRESEKLSELGEITISTRQLINQVEIKIGDTGQGMPADLVDKIFTPFFTTKAVGKGTGQGLAIAYKAIVESHHGDIKVDSEIGKGTIFTILLPISVPNAAPISKDVQ